MKTFCVLALGRVRLGCNAMCVILAPRVCLLQCCASCSSHVLEHAILWCTILLWVNPSAPPLS